MLINIGQLLTLASDKPGPRRGAHLGNLGILQDAAVLCVGGTIVSVGTSKAALRDSWIRNNRKTITEIDCENQVVLPGFVDSHTHPAFMQPRLVDFEQRISGATYEKIAEAGGGIRSSVEAVRRASRKQLTDRILPAFREMSDSGTTTVEAKSGYGLDLKSEIKSLEAIRDAAAQWPGTVVPTLLGAHVVPKEFASSSQKYVQIVCKEMIPAVARRSLAQYVDVFCDRGAFTAEQTEQIFDAAAQHGLAVRAHLGQLSQTRLQRFERFFPSSYDHMDYVHDEDVTSLAGQETVVTLLPGVNYFLGLPFPSARKLIDAGVAVGLATDYNPGSSPTASMPFAMSLACTHMKMSSAEAISASTINGAWALGLASSKGSIEPGKDADLVCFEVKDFREIPYWVASNRCAFTILNGNLLPRTSAA
ncbi:MAG: imidazolonepropionase [Acidobacteriales bacterium]|nr:imidazolonepropionase [Terriglobales bacterium]